MIVLIVIALAGLYAYNIWNPCVRYGAEQTVWITESCGENCWMIVPHTTRECLEREK